MTKLLADIGRLVEIPSFQQPSSPGMPFGPSIHQVLDKMLDICRREGFTTYRDPEGYYGYAQLGDGEDVFGVLCHLDVVPPGTLSEWTHPPFEWFVDESAAYGRGVQDDKGPTVIALHALSDLLHDGYQLKYPVRFIFGTDEENDWQCIEKYLADGQLIPTRGFVPDGSFPLTYAEKGLWQFYLTREGEDDLTLQGGVAFNVVPGEATYGSSSPELLEALESSGFEYSVHESTVTVQGKNAHAASAPEGKNALVGLLDALHHTGSRSEAARFVSEKLVGGILGEKLFAERRDEASGTMTVNLGLVDITPQHQVLGIDIRHPVTIPLAYFQEELTKQAEEFGFILEQRSYLDPLYVNRDSPLVRDLMASFRKVTGDETSQPEISGGATYARSMPNFVAFGASLPGSDETEHQPNERMNLENMKVAYQIYQDAFQRMVMKEKK